MIATTVQAIVAHAWTVVLLGARSKKPIGSHWQMTQDPDVVEQHLANQGGIGLVCGEPSGVAVVDVDDLTTWTPMVESLGMPGPTWVETGSGGTHIYVAWQPDLPAKILWNGRRVGELQRGPGQQHVVIPPSLHPNGRPYQWCLDPIATSLLSLPPIWQAYLYAESIHDYRG